MGKATSFEEIYSSALRSIAADKGRMSISLPRDISAISIPVHDPVVCTIIFDAGFASVNGSPMAVGLNGNEVANLTFTNEVGVKSATVNLTGVLKDGSNDLRCMAVAVNLFICQTKATIIVQSEGIPVIHREYVSSFFEFFDQHWQIVYKK